MNKLLSISIAAGLLSASALVHADSQVSGTVESEVEVSRASQEQGGRFNLQSADLGGVSDSTVSGKVISEVRVERLRLEKTLPGIRVFKEMQQQHALDEGLLGRLGLRVRRKAEAP